MAQLYPNTPFTDGSIFTPDLAYLAFNSPVFDGQNTYLGHRNKLTDAELDDGASSIKAKVAQVSSSLQVVLNTGLSVSVNSGYVELTNGAILAIPSTLVAIPDNSTSYVYIDTSGSVQIAATMPVVRVPLAIVTTVSGAVTTIADLRMVDKRRLSAIAGVTRIFGGVSVNDKVCTDGEVLGDGIYYFRNFTVNAGTSVTVSKFARIICSGQVNIAGTITVTPTAQGAGGYQTSVNTYFVFGGYPGAGLGGGSANYGNVSGATYGFGAQPYGSGGGTGFVVGSNATSTNTPTGSLQIGLGGSGGGGLILESALGITVTGNIYAKGANASPAVVLAGYAKASGNGGGSGGLIQLASASFINVTSSAVLDVSGGSGSNAVKVGAPGDGSGCMGGSGGGGGFVVLQSPNNNATGASIVLSGGALGTAISNPGDLGSGGGGGFAGYGGGQMQPGGTGKFLVYNFIPVG